MNKLFDNRVVRRIFDWSARNNGWLARKLPDLVTQAAATQTESPERRVAAIKELVTKQDITALQTALGITVQENQDTNLANLGIAAAKAATENNDPELLIGALKLIPGSHRTAAITELLDWASSSKAEAPAKDMLVRELFPIIINYEGNPRQKECPMLGKVAKFVKMLPREQREALVSYITGLDRTKAALGRSAPGVQDLIARINPKQATETPSPTKASPLPQPPRPSVASAVSLPVLKKEPAPVKTMTIEERIVAAFSPTLSNKRAAAAIEALIREIVASNEPREQQVRTLLSLIPQIELRFGSKPNTIIRLTQRIDDACKILQPKEQPKSDELAPGERLTTLLAVGQALKAARTAAKLKTEPQDNVLPFQAANDYNSLLNQAVASLIQFHDRHTAKPKDEFTQFIRQIKTIEPDEAKISRDIFKVLGKARLQANSYYYIEQLYSALSSTPRWKIEEIKDQMLRTIETTRFF